MASRGESRRNWAIEARMDQAENDLDSHDDQLEKLWERNNRLLWVLIGFVISFATGALLLAANLVVGGIGK